MATIKTAYTAKAAVTITLNSLASGAGRESTVVNNSVNLFLDALVMIRITGAASTTNMVDFYVYAALGDTVYTDAASGTDAAFTAANRRNSRYLGSIQMTTSTVLSGIFSVRAAFDGIMPEKWGLIAINNSGAALPASTHNVDYAGITATSA